MDKMGESECVGFKGVFGIFCDGVVVEIIGMFYSIFVWVFKFSKEGKYVYFGVKKVDGMFIFFE